MRRPPQSAPPPQWTEAVEQARRIVRARLAGQNLPGLSVAVGAGGDIVWRFALAMNGGKLLPPAAACRSP